MTGPGRTCIHNCMSNAQSKKVATQVRTLLGAGWITGDAWDLVDGELHAGRVVNAVRFLSRYLPDAETFEVRLAAGLVK